VKRCLISLAALCLAGCVPRERVAWSPTGDRAAVIIDHHLHLADERGRLTAELSPGADGPGGWLVEGLDWMPDGTGLAVHGVRVVSDWAEARSLLPGEEVASVERFATEIPALLTAAVALHGDSDRAEKLLDLLAPARSELLGSALRLAWQSRPDPIREVLRERAPRALDSLEHRGEATGHFAIHELSRIALGAEGQAPAAVVISRSLLAVESLKVSPAHPYLVCTRRRGSRDRRLSLEVHALDGCRTEVIQAEIDDAYDWTPDGRAVIYLAPLMQERDLVKQIRRIEILGSGGELLDKSVRKPRELATALVPFAPRLAVLPNGDVLFASQGGTLPVAAGDPRFVPRFHLIRAEDGAIDTIPTAGGILPMDLGHFVPSPDGRRVAVVESETDAVAVIDLADGRGEIVSPAHPSWKCRTLPAWKSPSELTFAALDPGAGSIRWALWRDDRRETTDLSRSWPESATQDWLEKKVTTNPIQTDETSP
jgi:hypothetical protein